LSFPETKGDSYGPGFVWHYNRRERERERDRERESIKQTAMESIDPAPAGALFLPPAGRAARIIA
jgi:hypothetical protein